MRAGRTGDGFEHALAHALVALMLGHERRHLILDGDGNRKFYPGLPARCAASVLFDSLQQHDFGVIAATGYRWADLVGDDPATADSDVTTPDALEAVQDFLDLDSTFAIGAAAETILDDEYHDYRSPEHLARWVIHALLPWHA